MSGDSGCCGFHFKKDAATFLGLITFSFPLVILASIIALFLVPLGKISRHIERIKKQVVLFLKININLINSISTYPKIRCAVSGKLFSYSPRLSGILYQNFNFLLFILIFSILSLPFIFSYLTSQYGL